MPLASKPLPREAQEEHVEEPFQHPVQVQHQTEGQRGGTDDEKDSGYEDFDDRDDCVDSDMEGSIMNRPRPKKASKSQIAPPDLPQRSEKRLSKVLDSMLLDLKALDGATRKELEPRPMVEEEDPHESYLSSEEDASLSDDYADSDLDLELESSSEASTSRPSSRKSQEDTAKVVSFTMVGKPQIVDIYINPSPTSARNRHSLNLEALNSSLTKSSTEPALLRPAGRRPPPLTLFPGARRLSTASIASSATTSTTATKTNASFYQPPAHSTSYIYSKPHSQSLANLHSPSKSVSGPLPPRKSSRITTNLSSLVSNTKSTLQQTLSSHSSVPSQPNNASHTFLDMDPYEAAHYQSPTSPEHIPTTPKTPTGASSAAWKMSRGFSRTLSKARKQSMPKINLAYANGAVSHNEPNMSKTSLALAHQNSAQAEADMDDEGEKDFKPKTLSRRSATMPTMLTDQPAKGSKSKYEDLMRNVLKAPPQPPSNTLKETKRVAMGAMMGLGRKKSVSASKRS